jgi:hypothetical protein
MQICLVYCVLLKTVGSPSTLCEHSQRIVHYRKKASPFHTLNFMKPDLELSNLQTLRNKSSAVYKQPHSGIML